ncbi:MAG: AAA family ATPase [Nitrospirae bacterium]|nr:AAA family ATPase [Nitrospirota bacterium]
MTPKGHKPGSTQDAAEFLQPGIEELQKEASRQVKADAKLGELFPYLKTWSKKQGFTLPDDALYAAIQKAFEWNNKTKYEPTEQQQPFDISKALTPISRIRAMDITQNFICDKIIPEQGVTLLSGAGGVGKSTLVMLLADAVSQSAPFLGFQTITKPVIYVDFENSLLKINEWARRYNLDNFFVWHTSNEIPPPRLDDKAWEQYKELPSGAVLIFDTLRACQYGDENSSKDMQAIMSRFKELRDLGFTIILLHHTAKGNSAQYKGSTAINDLCDHSIVLQKLKRGTQDEVFGDDETDVSYKLGTKDKTRYVPFSMFLEFELERGFYIADNPGDELLENMREIILSLGDKPTQKDIIKAAKDSLEIGRNVTIGILNRGDGTYWESKQANAKKPKIYFLIEKQFNDDLNSKAKETHNTGLNIGKMRFTTALNNKKTANIGRDRVGQEDRQTLVCPSPTKDVKHQNINNVVDSSKDAGNLQFNDFLHRGVNCKQQNQNDFNNKPGPDDIEFLDLSEEER